MRECGGKVIENTSMWTKHKRRGCRRTALLLASALLTLLSGCNAPRIKSSRNPAEQTTAPFQKVIVAGMDPRPEVRIAFENDSVLYLHEHKVDAIASHKQYSFDEMNLPMKQLLRQLESAGAQSVLFIRITDRNDAVEWSAAQMEVSDIEGMEEIPYSAAGTINTDLNLRARLYRVSDEALVWTGLVTAVTNENIDPIALRKRIARIIVDRMAKDKVIP